ncbi:MAG TPA: ATP-binding protein, partial [Chitinispirillaceae bacterium]|nr:ATP-binding protein [Chitinispirillaceae bacterium]
MKIKLKNLGVLRQAEFELGDMTIICGQNNTGKTYATYALFGFLSFWRDAFFIHLEDDVVYNLLQDGYIELDLESYVRKAGSFLEEGCKAYTKQLPTVFASPAKNFAESEFCITLDSYDLHPLSVFEQNIGSAKKEIFSITKKENEKKLRVTLLAEKEQIRIPE